jgi:hypothetical protein
MRGGYLNVLVETHDNGDWIISEMGLSEKGFDALIEAGVIKQ